MPKKWTRAVRYCLVSVVSIVISQVVLILAFGLAHMPARTSNVLACVAATGPSYYLNRTWAWGRRGKSSLWKEVLPFWGLAFLGLTISTWTTDAASAFARQSEVSHFAATTIVALAALAAFGTLWIGKFVVFNAVLFTDRRDEPTDTSSESPSMRAGAKHLHRRVSAKRLQPTTNK